jgi:hypothetical protein
MTASFLIYNPICASAWLRIASTLQRIQKGTPLPENQHNPHEDYSSAFALPYGRIITKW